MPTDGDFKFVSSFLPLLKRRVTFFERACKFYDDDARIDDKAYYIHKHGTI